MDSLKFYQKFSLNKGKLNLYEQIIKSYEEHSTDLDAIGFLLFDFPAQFVLSMDDLPPSASQINFGNLWKGRMDEPWAQTHFLRYANGRQLAGNENTRVGGLKFDLNYDNILPYDPKIKLADFMKKPLGSHSQIEFNYNGFNDYIQNAHDHPFFYIMGARFESVAYDDPPDFKLITHELGRCAIGTGGSKNVQLFVSPSGLTSFRLHREMERLWSVSLNLGGGPKLWLIIPGKERTKVVQLVIEQFGPQVFDGCVPNCPNPLPHFECLLAPWLLQERGIEFRIVVQRPGTGIALFGDALHQGINYGPVFAMSTHMTCPKQFQEYLERSDDCPNESGQISEDELDEAMEYCQASNSARSKKAYALNNPEKVAQKNKAYYEANKDTLKRQKRENLRNWRKAGGKKPEEELRIVLDDDDDE